MKKSKNRSHFFQFFLFVWHRVKIHERGKYYHVEYTFFNVFDKLLFFKESFFHNFTFHLKIFLLHKVKIPEIDFSSPKNEKFFNFFIIHWFWINIFIRVFTFLWCERFVSSFHQKVNSRQDANLLKKIKNFLDACFCILKLLFTISCGRGFLFPSRIVKIPEFDFSSSKNTKKLKYFISCWFFINLFSPFLPLYRSERSFLFPSTVR